MQTIFFNYQLLHWPSKNNLWVETSKVYWKTFVLVSNDENICATSFDWLILKACQLSGVIFSLSWRNWIRFPFIFTFLCSCFFRGFFKMALSNTNDFKQIYSPITRTISPGQSESMSNGREELLNMSQMSMNWSLVMRYSLGSYPGHFFFAERKEIFYGLFYHKTNLQIATSRKHFSSYILPGNIQRKY